MFSVKPSRQKGYGGASDATSERLDIHLTRRCTVSLKACTSHPFGSAGLGLWPIWLGGIHGNREELLRRVNERWRHVSRWVSSRMCQAWRLHVRVAFLFNMISNMEEALPCPYQYDFSHIPEPRSLRSTKRAGGHFISLQYTSLLSVDTRHI